MIKQLSQRTGFSMSEIVRRSIQLVRKEIEKRNGDISFLLEELAPDSPVSPVSKVMEKIETYGKEKKK